MKVKLLRDKYLVDAEGNDSLNRKGDIIDVDKDMAEVWFRRGIAEKTTEKAPAEKKE